MKSFLRALSLMLSFSALQAFAIDYSVEIDRHLDELLRIDSNTAKEGGTPNCIRRYENLYKDGVLNVAVGFGYWDNSPAEWVFDQWIANGLRAHLTAPCSEGRNVCGFKRAGDYYTKTVIGPDGKPNRFTVSITYGSLSPKNDENTTKFRAQQYQKCEAATNKFFGEVSRGSEVVMYIGHARNGGGPDFCPPVRDEHKHTNYPWYQKHKPGFTKLLSSMHTAQKAGRANQVVGLYSCNSKKHFYQRMNALTPDAGYILTDISIYPVPSINALVTTLDALIAQKCRGLAAGLRLTPGLNMNGMFVK